MPSRLVPWGGVFDRLGIESPRKSSEMSGKALHPDHVEFFAALGRRIRELRKERGWSLHDMVVKHGYYQSQWQKYEGGGPVTVDSLLRMATIFGMPLGRLIDDLGEFPRTDSSRMHSGEPTRPPKKTAAKKLAQRTSSTIKRGSRSEV